MQCLKPSASLTLLLKKKPDISVCCIQWCMTGFKHGMVIIFLKCEFLNVSELALDPKGKGVLQVCLCKVDAYFLAHSAVFSQHAHAQLPKNKKGQNTKDPLHNYTYSQHKYLHMHDCIYTLTGINIHDIYV